MAQQESVQILQQRLAYEQRLVQLVDRIHAAKGVDSIFIELQGEILGLLDADRMTIYAIDPAKKELYSKFLALDAVEGNPPAGQREEHRRVPWRPPAGW